MVTGVPAGLIAFLWQRRRADQAKGRCDDLHAYGFRPSPHTSAPCSSRSRLQKKVQRDHRDPTLRALEAKAKKDVVLSMSNISEAR